MLPYSRPLPSALPAFAANHDAPAEATNTALRRLFLAIECAPDHDLLTLLKDAIAAGANLSMRDGLGRDVISFAVLKDRPHAVGVLLALGASMPSIPPDGVDLLMQASKLDLESCCQVLVDRAGMDIDAVDAQGRSALHHAVHADSVAAVRFLLYAGCNPNLGTRKMSAASLREALGMHPVDEGRKVTPMMIAAARGDRRMIDMLLDMGADPNRGDLPPLHFAAAQHDAGMIAHLLGHGATIADSIDWATNTALLTAITHHAPVPCLRLLVQDYPFNTDDARDPDQVLQHAIRRGNVDAVALFIAHGAEPGEHPANSEPSVWQLAIDCHTGNLALTLNLLDQLASQRAQQWVTDARDIDCALRAFDCIVRAAGDPAAVASSGLFPSLVYDLQQRLQADPAGTDWSGRQQSALHAAWHYLAMLNQQQKPVAVLPTDPRDASVLAIPERHQASAALTTQRVWLQEAATLLVATSEDASRQLLTLAFFRRMTDDCPDHVRFDRHIVSQLSEFSSLPNSIIDLIAQAWYDAARDATGWYGDQIDLALSDGLVLQRALLGVARRTDSTVAAAGHPATAAWVADLGNSANERLALRGFANDPVRWLMKQEQRHNLRPVDKETLATSLCCELGLPPETSDMIAEAWEDIIQQLAIGLHGHTPQHWWRAAAKALSPTIANALVVGTSDWLPASVRTTAEIWCVQQTGPLPGHVSVPVPTPATQARSVDGEPPTKKARHQ